MQLLFLLSVVPLYSVLFFSEVVSGYTCADGCEISGNYYNDNYCDCTECEDEPNWTCASCPGCPSLCNQYVTCVGVAQSTDIPTTTTTSTTTHKPTTTDPNSYFGCDDGCQILANYYDDSYCDCAECEDEPNWSCESCRCPSTCGSYFECTGIALECNDGCEIPWTFLDDGYCDCAECEDEQNWNCSTCGGCVSICGDYVYCDSGHTKNNSTEAIEVCKDLKQVFDNSSATVNFDMANVSKNATGLYVYLDLAHSKLGDLSIFVEHANVIKELFDGYQLCVGREDLRAYFSDSGVEDACEGIHSYDRVYDALAKQSLADFNSLPKNGLWNVVVEDLVQGDEGTLKRVCIGWGNHSGSDPSTVSPTTTTTTSTTLMPTTTTVPTAVGYEKMCQNLSGLLHSSYPPVNASFNVSAFDGSLRELFVTVDVSHDYLSDLRVWVEHGGVSTYVFDRQCADLDNLQAIFHDKGSESVCNDSGAHSYDKVYDALSYESLDAYNSLSKAGSWNVSIHDVAFGGTGHVNELCIGWFVTGMCEDLNYDIEDYSTVTVPFNMSNIPENATGLYVYVDAIHSRLSDLDIYLEHGGVRKYVFNQKCDASDLHSYFSDDGSETLCSGTHSYDHVYDSVSYQSLAAFNSHSRNGLWTVAVNDNVRDIEGVLKRVCVGWKGATPKAPTTTTTLPPATTKARTTTSTKSTATSSTTLTTTSSTELQPTATSKQPLAWKMCKDVHMTIDDQSTVTVLFDMDSVPNHATGLIVYVDLEHNYLGDLVISVNNSNAKKNVFDHQCEGSVDLRGYFSDVGFEDVCEDHSYNRVYNASSYESLAAFNSLPKNGKWAVNVTDDATGDKGTLKQVCLGWSTGSKRMTTTLAPATTKAMPTTTSTGLQPTAITKQPFAWEMCKDVNKTIVDHSTVTVPFDMNSVPNHATGLYVYIDLMHSYLEDLRISVGNDKNTTKYVLFHECGGNHDLRAYFSDDGTEDVCVNRSYNRVYNASSDELLAAFNSLPKKGDWTVNVTDAATGDEGTLKRVCLGWSTSPMLKTTTTAPPFAWEMCKDVNERIADYSSAIVPFDMDSVPNHATGLFVYVDLEHTYLGDLGISVANANGITTKNVFYHQCDDGDDLRAYFSDGGSDELCVDHSYDTRVYNASSYESLTAFNSLSKKGVWTVNVTDAAMGDEGTLKRVCLGWGIYSMLPKTTTAPPSTKMLCHNFSESLNSGISPVTAVFNVSQMGADAHDFAVSVRVTHNELNDVRIWLEHGGVRKYVFDRQCDDLSDLRAVFHDKGSENVCYDSKTHSYDKLYDALPYESLAVFNSMPKTGIYNVSISDDYCCGTGFVHQLCLGWVESSQSYESTTTESWDNTDDSGGGNDGNSGLSGGAIAGIVIGCVIVLAFMVGYFVHRFIATKSPAIAAAVGIQHAVAGNGAAMQIPAGELNKAHGGEDLKGLGVGQPVADSLEMAALGGSGVFVEALGNRKPLPASVMALPSASTEEVMDTDMAVIGEPPLYAALEPKWAPAADPILQVTDEIPSKRPHAAAVGTAELGPSTSEMKPRPAFGGLYGEGQSPSIAQIGDVPPAYSE